MQNETKLTIIRGNLKGMLGFLFVYFNLSNELSNTQPDLTKDENRADLKSNVSVLDWANIKL